MFFRWSGDKIEVIEIGRTKKRKHQESSDVFELNFGYLEEKLFIIPVFYPLLFRTIFHDK